MVFLSTYLQLNVLRSRFCTVLLAHAVGCDRCYQGRGSNRHSGLMVVGGCWFNLREGLEKTSKYQPGLILYNQRLIQILFR